MVSINNVINNTIGASNSGNTNTLTLTNPSNTASSAARQTITVGGTSAANPTLNFDVSGSTDFEIGIDNSDSQKLKISQSTALGTKDVWRMTKAGVRTMPLQSLVIGGKNTSTLNATGDGTIVTILYNVVNLDPQSSYNPATGVFTAPVTASYCFITNLFFNGIAAGHTSFQYNLSINGSPVGIYLVNSANMTSPSGLTLEGFLATNLTAGDAVTFQVVVSGSTKTVNIGAGDYAAFLIY